MFRLLAVVALLYSYFQIKTGLPQVAGRRPGLEVTVWISLWIEVLITVILLAVPWIARSFPECVHFGWRRLSDYTPTQRNRIIPLLKGMVGLMALAANLFLGFDIHQHLTLARYGRVAVPSPQSLVGLLVCQAIIVWYYLGRFEQEAGRG